MMLEADSIRALGVNCIAPAMVGPALQVQLMSSGLLVICLIVSPKR